MPAAAIVICRTRTARPKSGWAILLASGLLLNGQGAEPTSALPAVGFWDTSCNLRAGMGYRDNVLYSAVQPEASSFVLTGIDFMTFHLGADGSQLIFLVSGDDKIFLNENVVPKEQYAFVQTSYKKEFLPRWTFKSTVGYVYQDQVFDASESQDLRMNVHAQGHRLNAAQLVRYDLPRDWHAEASVEGVRQWLASPLDSYWELTPEFTLGWDPNSKTDLSLNYRFTHRPYDHRVAADTDGTPREGTKLAYAQHDWFARWRQSWGSGSRWSSTWRAGLVMSLDNGGGYYDYDRLYGGLQLTYKLKRWALIGGARCDYYDYPYQAISEDDPRLRQKTLVVLNARSELKLGKRWMWFVEYEFEQSFAPADYDQYAVNTVSSGMDFEF
jgi:hypothetical protein